MGRSPRCNPKTGPDAKISATPNTRAKQNNSANTNTSTNPKTGSKRTTAQAKKNETAVTKMAIWGGVLNFGGPGHHRGSADFFGDPGRRRAGPAWEYGGTNLADRKTGPARPAAHDSRAPALAIHAAF